MWSTSWVNQVGELLEGVVSAGGGHSSQQQLAQPGDTPIWGLQTEFSTGSWEMYSFITSTRQPLPARLSWGLWHQMKAEALREHRWQCYFSVWWIPSCRYFFALCHARKSESDLYCIQELIGSRLKFCYYSVLLSLCKGKLLLLKEFSPNQNFSVPYFPLFFKRFSQISAMLLCLKG